MYAVDVAASSSWLSPRIFTKTLRTAAPVHDFSFVYFVAGVVRGSQAGSGTHGTIDVDHAPASTANKMVVVVTNSILVTCWRPSGLNAPDEAFVNQHPQSTVHRLARNGSDLCPDGLGNIVGGAVWSSRHRL